MERLFPDQSNWEILLTIASTLLVGVGLGTLAGAAFDRFVTMRREAAPESDFSLEAMRDRRVRKMNDHFLRRGLSWLGAGIAGYVLLALI